MNEYPHLRFRRHWEIGADVEYQLGQCDAISSAIAEMPLRPEYRRSLLGVALIKGAQATTAIEGNTLTEEEIERVAQGEALAPSKEYQQIEVKNVLDAMNALLEEVASADRDSLISPDLILRFHRLIGKDLGQHLDAIPGRFRDDFRVVGRYRCPDPREVPKLVSRLCEWLREEFGYPSGRQSFREAVIEAIVAHVYLEWIHPFGDGNGRTGRLLEFYLLLRAGNPDLASHILSNFYNQTRPEYYRQLEVAGKRGDLSSFIAYAVQGFRDGLLLTLELIQRSQFETAWRSFIYDRFAGKKYRKTVFKRRRNLILEAPIGEWLTFDEIALTSPRVARDYGGLSERTLQRDLEVLIEMDLLAMKDRKYAANTVLLRQLMPSRRRVGS
ncbi:MAG: Fic family protein [Acidobacteriota bacterium]